MSRAFGKLPTIAPPAIGKENEMSRMVNDIHPSPMKRRSFFGYLAAGVAGGFFVGGMIRRLLSTKARPSHQDQSIHVSSNPLAVPKTKEGSKSHV
jgi:hypothetical protein